MNLVSLKLVFDNIELSYTLICASCTCMCRSPDRNLGRSGICLGQIGILFWPMLIPDLPKDSLGQIRIPIWLGRFRICLGQIGIFD